MQTPKPRFNYHIQVAMIGLPFLLFGVFVLFFIFAHIGMANPYLPDPAYRAAVLDRFLMPDLAAGVIIGLLITELGVFILLIPFFPRDDNSNERTRAAFFYRLATSVVISSVILLLFTAWVLLWR